MDALSSLVVLRPHKVDRAVVAERAPLRVDEHLKHSRLQRNRTTEHQYTVVTQKLP